MSVSSELLSAISFASSITLCLIGQKVVKGTRTTTRPIFEKIYPPPISFSPTRSGHFFTSDLKDSVDISLENSGANSLVPQTVIELFAEGCRTHGARTAFAVKRVGICDGSY